MNRSFTILFLCILLTSPLCEMTHSGSTEYCHCGSEPLLQRTANPPYNDLIYQLQCHWASLSLFPNIPNGRFDRMMETAVIRFQKNRHLKANGMLDQPTWEAIGVIPAKAKLQENLPPGRLEILVDLDRLTLTILVNHSQIYTFPVAIGTKETPSPVGTWQVTHKGYWEKGKTKWLRLSVPFGSYGIHGTNQPWSIGRRASNGCIRMFNHHLEDVYRWVEVGTPVYVLADPFRDRRLLKRGMNGSDVYFLQLRLKQLGCFNKRPNGYFEYWTEVGLKECQQKMGLPVTGELSPRDYHKLKLYWTD